MKIILIFSLELIQKFNVLVRFLRNWYEAYVSLHLLCIVRFMCSVAVYSYFFVWNSKSLSFFECFELFRHFELYLVFRPGPFWGVRTLRYVRAFRDVVGGLSGSVVPCYLVIFILCSNALLLLGCYYTYTYEAIRTIPPLKLVYKRILS
jgi:hypothetical protein